MMFLLATFFLGSCAAVDGQYLVVATNVPAAFLGDRSLPAVHKGGREPTLRTPQRSQTTRFASRRNEIHHSVETGWSAFCKSESESSRRFFIAKVVSASAAAAATTTMVPRDNANAETAPAVSIPPRKTANTASTMPDSITNTDNNDKVNVMRAMQIHTDGRQQPAEQVYITKPEPSNNQVRVRVINAAIDTGTPEVVNKTFNSTFLHSMEDPIVIGWHYAGIIDKVGDNVVDFQVGDSVFGHLEYAPSQTQGTFSEYITIDSDKTCVKPERLAFDVAAASTTEGLTALQAMRDCGGLSRGNEVLVIGAGGGVGSAAVQIAKNLGAHVTAVCSTKDVERVQSYGADVVIDRQTTPNFLQERADAFHVIFDTPACSSWLEASGALKKGGHYVATLPTLAFVRDSILSCFSSTQSDFVSVEPRRQDLETLGGWLENGSVKIGIDSHFRVSELNKGIARQNLKSRVGRVVIDVADGWKEQ